MQKQFRRLDLFWVVGYLALLAGVSYGLFWGKNWATREFGTSELKADWERWRQDVASQEDSQQPVKRRVPKSVEPPALVLMRDYFGICFVGSILLSSVLYGAFVFMLRGALLSPGPNIAGKDEGPPNYGH